MNHLVAFFRALLLLTTAAFAERVIFANYHSHLSAGMTFWQSAGALTDGIRFDLAVSALLALIAYLPSYGLERLIDVSFGTVFRRMTYLMAMGLVLVQGADLLYFEEAGRHLGYEISEAYNSSSELISFAFSTYTWQVMMQMGFLAITLAAIYVTLPNSLAHRPFFSSSKYWYRRFIPEGQLVVVLFTAAILARGGFQSVPLEPLHAQALGDPKRAALALNGAYNAAFSLATPYSVARVIGSPTEEQKRIVAALYASSGAPALCAGDTPQPNVVILFLESWSASHMSSYGGGRITTPFFDDLRGRSFTTREMLAGGHRTTEGLFATLCSAQNPLGATVAQSQLQNYEYSCLPKKLRSLGYHTVFFQGTVSGTSGTGPFAQLLGFEQSYGKEHVARHRLPFNNWGLHDPDLYRFALEKMAALPQPFLVGINTNSTHDHLLPPGAPIPFDPTTPSARYDNALHFADGALREFVDALSANYPNTILVALGDHAGPHQGPAINGYRIPFLVHAPGLVEPGMVDTIAGQRDVAPTLLQILKIPSSSWFTGQSLLEPYNLAADFYQAGMLGWVEGDTGIEIPLHNPESVRCFTTKGDFAATPCLPEAPRTAKRAIAVTAVLQNLLFNGRTKDFSHYRTARELKSAFGNLPG